jgi:mannosyltransferase
MSLVIHPHFHFRRTGTTRHVESVVRALEAHVETRAVGMALEPQVPRLSFGQFWSRVLREPVVWHAHRNNELFVGLLLRLLGRSVRVIYTRHAAHRPSFITRFLYRRADRIVSLTREVADAVEVPSDIVGHGVDLERFRPAADRSAAWSRLGLGGKFGVGVVGRIRPPKGQGDFAEAITPLLDQYPGWRPVLVGRAKEADAGWAQELVKSTSGRLALVGEQKDVAPWYQGLSVMVQPSHSEGYSLVVLEAMASGCCVVAAQLPHFPELIEHGRTGFLYPPGDIGALRGILESLMRDPALAEAVGRKAAESARRAFGVEREADALLEIYRPLLAARAG